MRQERNCLGHLLWTLGSAHRDGRAATFANALSPLSAGVVVTAQFATSGKGSIGPSRAGRSVSRPRRRNGFQWPARRRGSSRPMERITMQQAF